MFDTKNSRRMACTLVLLSCLPCGACKSAEERASANLAEARQALSAGEPERAEELLEEAAELSRFDTDVREALGKLLIQRGKSARAREVMRDCSLCDDEIGELAAQHVLDDVLAKGEHGKHAAEIIELATEAGGFQGCGLLKAIQLAEADASQADALLAEVHENIQPGAGARADLNGDFVASARIMGSQASSSEDCEALRGLYYRVEGTRYGVRATLGAGGNSLNEQRLRDRREAAFLAAFVETRLSEPAAESPD